MNVEVAAWAIWALLGGGALLTTLSLLHSIGRFREWKSVQTEHEGEIMLADRVLEPGQQAQIAYPVLPYPLATRLTRMFRRTLYLALETPDSRVPVVWPPVGAMVSVTMTGASEQFQFLARVRDIDSDAGELLLSRPTWLARIQRRRHARANLCLPVTFEHATSGSAPPIHGTILNLSGGGFRAEIGKGVGVNVADSLIKAFPPDSTLRVRLPLPSLSDPLLARVLTCERKAVRGGLAIRLTCEFLPISHWEEEILIHHVFLQYRK